MDEAFLRTVEHCCVWIRSHRGAEPKRSSEFAEERKTAELLCGLGPQMLQNGLLEASWGYLAGWGLKCFKIVLWRPPGATLRGWGPKCFKTVFWRPPGGL